MTKAKKREEIVSTSELNLMSSPLNNIRTLQDIDFDKNAMHGNFEFSHQFGEINVHISRLTQKQDMNTSSELSPRLSVNILFEGEFDFALGDEVHHLGKRYPNAVECSAYVLERNEILTRYQKADVVIAKMNVSVDCDWLMSRCTSQHQRQQMINLFEHHAVVSHWPACDRVIELANLLMNKGDSNIEQALQNEYRAIELVSTFTKVLMDSLKDQQSPVNVSSRDLLEEGRITLKQMVNASLPGCNNLEDIASKLKLSVSTLQRKFKQGYDMTVIEYVRIQKLEMARSGLLFKGLSIGEVSYLAGYNHASNFATAFKKQFGVTPTALLVDLQKNIPK